MKLIVTILLFVIGTTLCVAQSDTILLHQVEVQSAALKDEFATGASVVTWDSTVLNQYQGDDVGALLSSESGVFIKSYGLGSLATSSVRGAGAQHTKVLWNGFDITNPMLGQADLSYLSVNAFDQVSLHAGNIAGLYGGGTQGGVIRLNSSTAFDAADYIQLGMGFGSFNDFSRQINLKTSNKNVATKVVVSSRNAENNFDYTYNGATQKRENADVTTFSGMVSNTIKLSPYHRLEINNWYQQNDRGIPTVSGVPKRGERLQNEFLRNMLNYHFYGKKIVFRIGGAHFNESLTYIDPLSDVVSTSRFTKTAVEAESKWKAGNHTDVIVGVNNTIDQVFTENYTGDLKRNTLAAFMSLKHSIWKDRLVLNPSLRQEMIVGFQIPPTGSLGYAFTPKERISVFGNVSKNYRIPTFNDLYYGNLGNPDLRPENGWGGEQSVSIRGNHAKVTSAVFYNEYRDWISWQPQVGGRWRPINSDVITQGIEARLELNKKVTKGSAFYMRSNVTYVKSVNMRTGLQLIYVPKIKAGGTVGMKMKNTSFSYAHDANGVRFISTDNMSQLPLFQLGTLRWMQRFPVKENGSIETSFTIHNLWNAEYQALLNFPMPGRYYTIQINITFKNNQHDKTTS